MKSKTLGIVFCTLGLLCLAWIAASWADVVLHNNSGGAQSAWNAFRLIVGG